MQTRNSSGISCYLFWYVLWQNTGPVMILMRHVDPCGMDLIITNSIEVFVLFS